MQLKKLFVEKKVVSVHDSAPKVWCFTCKEVITKLRPFSLYFRLGTLVHHGRKVKTLSQEMPQEKNLIGRKKVVMHALSRILHVITR